MNDSDQPEADAGFDQPEFRFWPTGACQRAPSVAKDDHLLSQSLIQAVGALIASIWYR